jgi:hypothetical protein
VNAHCHRHTPVYFFFCSPTLTDICISMTIIPKVLVNIQTQDQSITSVGCLTQINSVLTFGGLENCLLDNCGLWSLYGHLSPPLRYTVIMNPCVCVFLVLSSWLLALLSPCSIVWWCCTCPSAHTWKFPASSVNLFRSSSGLFWSTTPSYTQCQAYLLVCLLLGLFSLMLKFPPLFWGSHYWGEGIKLFPLVGPKSSLL